MVGGNFRDFLVNAIRPLDIDVGGFGGAEAEVQAKIVDRIETSLTEDGLGLHFTAITNADKRADGGAIGNSAEQFHFQPVAGAGHVVTQ